MADEKKNYESTFTDETFDLGAGEDSIRFSGYYGHDRVILSKGETVDLVFDSNEIDYKIDGKNLVLTTESERSYYATVKFDHDYVVDGNMRNEDGSMVHISILDKLYDVKYDLIEGATADSVITQAEYNELSVEEKALYVFKEGTMMLDYTKIGSKVYWGVNHLYDLVIDGQPDQQVPFGLTNSDIAAIATSNKNGGTIWYDLEQEYVKLSEFTIYQVVNGDEMVDVTAAYVKAINGKEDSDDSVILAYMEDTTIESTVTLVNMAGKDTGATVLVNGASIYEQDAFTDLLYHDVDNDAKLAKGKYVGNAFNEIIDANDYVSKDGVKGVTIIAGAGDDIINTSAYNDVVKASGGNNIVNIWGGKNKVTTGKGDDFVKMYVSSSTTAKLGAGNNFAFVEYNDAGTNKITTGAGDDAIELRGGKNTVKAGDGNNVVVLNWGENKVTTGKGNDMYYVGGGNNNIKSGNGNDVFRIGDYGSMYDKSIDLSRFHNDGTHSYTYVDKNDGANVIKTGNGNNEFIIYNDKTHNKITTGKGTDTFNLMAGTNYISSGAGVDTFTVTGGYNFLDGGKGDDIYDFSNVDGGTARVTDTKGANVLNLGEKEILVFFDVEVGKKGNAIYNDIRFIGDDGNVTSEDFYTDMYVSNKKSFAKISSAYTEGQEVTFNVSDLASQVASWLTENDYASTDAVFAKNDSDDVAALLAMYTDYSQNGYQVEY